MKALPGRWKGGVSGFNWRICESRGSLKDNVLHQETATRTVELRRSVSTFFLFVVILSGAMGSFANFVPKRSLDIRAPMVGEHLRHASMVMVDRVSISVARPWAKKTSAGGDSSALPICAAKASAGAILGAVLACWDLSPCSELQIYTYLARAPPCLRSHSQ